MITPSVHPGRLSRLQAPLLATLANSWMQNERPLTVTDLVERFGKSAYTIRGWAKKGRLKGAKRVGRNWAFPLDVDYVDGAVVAIAPTVQVAVKQALELLDRYPIGAPRAA